MWCEINGTDFSVSSEGFKCRSIGDKTLYHSAGTFETQSSVRDLLTCNYAQAIEVDKRAKKVIFGRDYLGHFPLLFTSYGSHLFIADEIEELIAWRKKQAASTTVAEEALALYFAMGYVPQGMSLFNEVYTCKNATLYHWSNSKVTEERCFKPIMPDPLVGLVELENEIESAIEWIFKRENNIDVWCSGGLDSSIISLLANEGDRSSRLLTIDYPEEMAASFGVGELPFAQEMAQFLGLDLERLVLDRDTYSGAYKQVANGHPCPVIDMCIVPKYALAKTSRQAVLTGEGGDPLFSGVKNNVILYALSSGQDISIGELYAASHKRCFDALPALMKRGDDLKAYVIDYMAKLFDQYPGDLTRQLFYINTFEKQGGLIFLENYYAAKRNNIRSYHPLTMLNVYSTAFAMEDVYKYRYPKGKLALLDLYKKKLPRSIIERKKSGTRLPLDLYMEYVDCGHEARQALLDTGYFNDSKMIKGGSDNKNYSGVLQQHAIAMLSNWLFHYTN